MTRMNLNTFARHGVFKHQELVNIVARRLKDRNQIQSSRVFPYQLMIAWVMTSSDVPRQVTDALHKAMEIALDNVPAFAGKVYVCVDVSASMNCSVSGYRQGASSKVRCVDVAALMAASVLRNNPEAVILPFDTKVVSLKLNRFDSVITNAEKLAGVCGGGTNCSAPLVKLNKAKAEGELIIMVSDNESWADARFNRGTAMMNEWQKFKGRNPQSKLVCIDIQPNANSQVQDCKDVLNIGGFSDEIFKLIDIFHREGFESQGFIREIEATQV